MKKRTKIILFILIVLFGSLLRLWEFGNVPRSPDWDEAAIAYNAHSIATTGRDEYGASYPLILRSFNDYKPGLYAYLAIPSIEIFGLTTFAVRLPSVLFGILAIVAIYFLAGELFKKWRYKEVASLLVTFLLAISPWHIQFSRVAFETNVGLTLNILVALFFLKGLRRHWLLLPAALLAGLNLSIYQSERVFTPLLVIALIVIYRKEFFSLPKKYITFAFTAGIIVLLPTIFFLSTNHNALERIRGTSYFSDQTEVLKKNTARLQSDAEKHDIIGTLFDNRRLTYAKHIVGGYISHFDPQWLFLTGDNPRHHAPKMGLIYLVFLPFILIGIYKFLFGDYDKKSKYLVFSWFFLAPVPASITADVPHAVRTLNFLPTYEIFIALGLISVYLYLSKMNYRIVMVPLKYVLGSIIIFAFMFNFFYYLNQYFIQQNYLYAYDWQYGYQKAVTLIEQRKSEYKKVIVSERAPLDNSYIFFLFYSKFPPQQYQKIDHAENHDFDKYEFHTFKWDEMKDNKEVLLIGGSADFPEKVVYRERISYPNGNPAILIVDPKDNK